MKAAGIESKEERNPILMVGLRSRKAGSGKDIVRPISYGGGEFWVEQIQACQAALLTGESYNGEIG